MCSQRTVKGNDPVLKARETTPRPSHFVGDCGAVRDCYRRIEKIYTLVATSTHLLEMHSIPAGLEGGHRRKRVVLEIREACRLLRRLDLGPLFWNELKSFTSILQYFSV
ncbi:unnamed protein product [Ixodes pacificus]